MARILVVDDVRGVRRSVAAILTRAGHDVAEADNGVSGMALLDQQTFDIVVTDILMPEADGSELIAKLRRRPGGPKVIAMSGGGSLVRTEDALVYARQAADAALEKPFDAQDLLNVVDRLIGKVAS